MTMKITHAFAGLVATVLFGASPAFAQSPPITMKLTTSSSNDADVEWLNALKKGIDAHAGGRLKVEVYPGSQLGSAQRTIEGTTMGTVEVTLNASGFYESLEPRFGILSASGIFDSMEHGDKVLNDPQIRKLLSGYGGTKGYEVLSVFMHSPLTVVSIKPVQHVADLQSKKIRVPGSPIFMNTFKALGAAPLSMSISEVLPAMQNGTIDGAVGGSTIFPNLKYYDVAKSMTYLPASNISVVAIINSKFLKTIGPELEAIVREAAMKADQHIYKWSLDDVAANRVTWEKNGGKSLALTGADATQFLAASGKVANGLFGSNPQLASDYKTFSAVAHKYQAPAAATR